LIDIHCHILPGIDDGPGDMKESLAMARLAVKDGIRSIVATPHCCDGVYNCQEYDIVDLCARFNKALHLEKIDLKVFPGAEVRLTPELPLAIEQGKVMKLAGGKACVLLELPEMFIVEGAVRTIKLLRRSGIRCIIAHPERNSLILGKKEVLQSLIAVGAEMQITGGSLTGDFDRNSRNLANLILQMPVTSYLASDGHCSRRRKPLLAKAVKAAAKSIGHERAKMLVSYDLREDLPATEEYACNQ
jgi:protein-tyrosine phosphatase